MPSCHPPPNSSPPGLHRFYFPNLLYTTIHTFLSNMSGTPPATEVRPGWFLGGVGGRALERSWGATVDLTAEFPEPCADQTLHYLLLPCWDGVPPTPDQVLFFLPWWRGLGWGVHVRGSRSEGLPGPWRGTRDPPIKMRAFGALEVELSNASSRGSYLRGLDSAGPPQLEEAAQFCVRHQAEGDIMIHCAHGRGSWASLRPRLRACFMASVLGAVPSQPS